MTEVGGIWELAYPMKKNMQIVPNPCNESNMMHYVHSAECYTAAKALITK